MSDRTRHTTRHPGVMYRESLQGRRYIVAFTDSNGRRHTGTLPLGTTLAEALTFQGQLHARKAMGESLIRTKCTVSELLDGWLEQRRVSIAPKTAEVYGWAIEKHLVPAFGQRKVTELSPSDVARLIASLKQEGMKTWTVKKILTPLQGAYQVAVREGWVTTSPVTKLLPHERPKGDQREMRCLSSSEIASLLEATSTRRWRALFSTLVFSGLRVGEALALTWDDIEDDKIIVRKSKTKAGEREVLLIPSVRRLLASVRLSQPPGASLVFGTASDTPISRREALRALRVAEKKANIPNYTLHELRHTFASILIGQGELPTLVAKQMGHADPSITLKVYSHLWEENESVAVARERLQESMGGVL